MTQLELEAAQVLTLPSDILFWTLQLLEEQLSEKDSYRKNCDLSGLSWRQAAGGGGGGRGRRRGLRAESKPKPNPERTKIAGSVAGHIRNQPAGATAAEHTF